MTPAPQLTNKYLYLILVLIISTFSIVGLISLESQFDNAKATSSNEKIIDQLHITVGDKPNVLIWTSARWCSLCATMRNAIKDIAAEYSAQLEVIEIDIDDNPTAIATFPTSAPPTFYLFNKERELVLTFGAEEQSSLRSRLISYIDLRP